MQSKLEIIKSTADAKVKEFLSQFPLEVHAFCDRQVQYAIGYTAIDGDPFTNAEKLKSQLIGQGPHMMTIGLGEISDIHFVAKIPYTRIGNQDTGKTLILHKDSRFTLPLVGPAGEPASHYNITCPFSTSRMLDDPHAQFTRSRIAELHKLGLEKQARLAKKNPLAKKCETPPDFADKFHYVLAGDLTKGGKYELFDCTHLYASNDGEYINCKPGLRWSTQNINCPPLDSSYVQIVKTFDPDMKKTADLIADHFERCSTIQLNLMRGKYKQQSPEHTHLSDSLLYAAKGMFSFRLEKETGELDMVMHNRQGLLLYE